MRSLIAAAVLVLTATSVLGAVRGASSLCYAEAVAGASETHMAVDSAALAVSVEARVRSSAPWSLEWGTLKVVLKPLGAAEADPAVGGEGVSVEVSVGGRSLAVSHIAFPEADPSGFNTVVVDRYADAPPAIFVGAREPVPVKVRFDNPLPPSAHVRLVAGKKAEVEYMCAETWPDRRNDLVSGWTEASLASRFASSADPAEGFYAYLDRENDPSRGVVGGRYRLALVSDGTGGYDIIYCSGAVANGAAWSAGMIKGRMRPTIFADTYTLEWNDSLLEPVTGDMSARIEQGAVLKFDFPLYKLSFRLAKER